MKPPYYSLNTYLQETYGEKMYKLSLNANMTCPNRDGTLDTRGCIFCSAGGSGDFAENPSLTITQQIESGKKRVQKKMKGNRYIAYFQAYTNTYAPISYLQKIFYEAISHPEIAILSIATRPDCLSPQVLSLLKELNEIKPVWVELGLQTIHPKSAEYIRRGYPLSCFDKAVKSLHSIGIEVIAHMILGLPGENKTDMLATANHIAHLQINGIKLQLLHIIKGTDLAKDFFENKFEVLELSEYTDIVVSIIERLPKHMVVHRMTGDGPKNLLLAPLWSGNKRNVLNTIHHEFRIRNTWQGKYR
ncbi:MAG: TIGR01212 family radical SAM protein [Lachnospiraceae bacterium]|nr:TIGR01212 family radical SAM protein [Lachnospiraceae bacterium]